MQNDLDPKGLQSEICDALLNAFPMADKIADHYAAVAVAAVSRHLSATVPAGDGEAFGTAWQTSYTGDEWHFAREASFSTPDLERGIVKNVTPLFAASRLSQGTGVTIERAFKDGVHYATIVDVPNTEEARDEAWRCSKVRALSGDTL